MMDRRLNNSETHWTSANGRTFAIRELSDGHLINILRYLHRNARDFHLGTLERFYGVVSNINGDMAQEAVDSEIRMIERMDDEEFLGYWFKAYDPMVEEANRRRIQYRGNMDKETVRITGTTQGLSAPRLMISFQPKGS